MKKSALLLIALLSIILAGCGAQELYLCADGTPGGGQVPTESKIVYFCPDGTETTNVARCSFEQQVSITLKDAEQNAINFVNGYVRSSGWSATLINAYREGGEYLAQVVVSKPQEQSYETTVVVDGVKGTVSCRQNCVYTTQIR